MSNAENQTTAQPLFPGNAEWFKSLFVAPANAWSGTWQGGLGFTASCLQDQAAYLRQLGQCKDPTDALKCHTEFAQKCWQRSFKEGSRIFDSVRASFSSAVAER